MKRRPGPPRKTSPQPKSEAPNPGLALRIAAHGLLLSVIEGHRPFDEGFESAAAGRAPRDRAFIRRLATSALRRFGQAEALIGTLLDKGPLPARQGALRCLLVMGATELLFLATPPHAAIDSAVRLAQARPSLAGQAGLVNAVLRRLSREFPDRAAVEAKLEALAPASLNTPDWLRTRWVRNYGCAAADAFARAHTAEPPLDLTIKEAPALWAARLEADILPTGTLRRPVGGRIGALPGYAEGAWWVQDAAAALPARLLGDVAGRAVLDLCAAPGGKSAQLAAAGAQVMALDRDAGRLARLELNLQRLGLSASFECADAARWEPPRQFPFILLDAPCSATGTIRRHPDLPWLKRESDLVSCAQAQAGLLDAALRALAPGGVLVYAVCSLEPEEGEAQIDALLTHNSKLRSAPITAGELPGIEPFVTEAGYLRTTPAHWPERGGLDGFFAARIVARG